MCILIFTFHNYGNLNSLPPPPPPPSPSSLPPPSLPLPSHLHLLTPFLLSDYVLTFHHFVILHNRYHGERRVHAHLPAGGQDPQEDGEVLVSLKLIVVKSRDRDSLCLCLWVKGQLSVHDGLKVFASCVFRVHVCV